MIQFILEIQVILKKMVNKIICVLFCKIIPPINRYFKRVVNSDYIWEWKSNGLSDGSIKSPSAPHNFLNPSLNYLGTKTRVRFSGKCLTQDKLHTLTEKL